MVMSVNITPDGRATEVSTEQAAEEKGARIYGGAALRTPEHWETDHDHAGLVRLRRGRDERPGADDLSPHEVEQLHAEQHHLRNGLYRKRKQVRYHQLHNTRPGRHLQTSI